VLQSTSGSASSSDRDPVVDSVADTAGVADEDIKLSHGPINLKKNDVRKVKMSNYFKIGIVLYCKGIYEAGS